MTKIQNIILDYIKCNYDIQECKAISVGFDKIKIEHCGKERLLGANLFGDIIDIGSGQIIAVSNIKHSYNHIFEIPTRWICKKEGDNL